MTLLSYLSHQILKSYNLLMYSNSSEQGHPASAENFSRERPNIPSENNIPSQLGPRYHQPTRINADDKSNNLLCLYASVIIFPLIICIIISVFALPNATKSINPQESLMGTNLANCQGILQRPSLSTNNLECYKRTSFIPGTINSLGIFVKLFSNLNQFMLFYIDLSPFAKTQKNPDTNFNQTIIFTVYVASYSNINKTTAVVGKLHDNNITVTSNVGKLAQKQYFLGYQSKIADGQQFFVEVGFQNNSAITSPKMFNLNVETVQQNFTIYTILLRVAFFLVSFAVFILYYLRLSKIPKQKVSIQQRIVQVVAALTLLFNDQLYFVTVLWPNPVSSFLSALFIWTFIFAVYVLWIFFLLRILEQQPDTESIELMKGHRIVVLTLFYLIGLTVCAGSAIIQAGDYPMIAVSAINYTWFRVYLSFLIFCFVLALFYLFYLYVEICAKRQYRAHRHNVFMFISLLFTSAIIVVTLMGSFQVFNFSGGLVFFTFAFSNFYSYFLQYLYSPTTEQLEKFTQTELYSKNHRTEDIQEAKTVNIQLLQIEEAPESQENENRLELNSSVNSQSENGSEKRIRKRRKHQRQAKGQMNKGETQDKILKEQEDHKYNKGEISMEQQYQHDI